MLALAGATACGGRPIRVDTAASARQVAGLLRATWGVSTGFPAFDYTCTRLDDRGRLFTCLAQDQYDLVKLASFDVICEGADCRWTSYPAYLG